MHALLTQESGFFAVVATILYTAAAVAIPFAQENVIVDWTPGASVTTIVLISAAIAASGVLLLGVNVQVAGVIDAIAGVVTTMLVLAVLAALLFGWFLFGWLGLLVATTAITMARARASHWGTGVPTALLGYAWPAFTLLVLVAASFLTGQTGLPGLPGSLAVVVFDVVALPLVFVFYAVGNLMLGQRMRALAPDVPPQDDDGPGPVITG